MGQIIKIKDAVPESALERLNRLTGLEFDQWPESILDDLEEFEDGDYPLPEQRVS